MTLCMTLSTVSCTMLVVEVLGCSSALLPLHGGGCSSGSGTNWIGGLLGYAVCNTCITAAVIVEIRSGDSCAIQLCPGVALLPSINNGFCCL